MGYISKVRRVQSSRSVRSSLKLGTSENEEIFLPRVSMNIDKEVNLSALESLFDHVLHAVYLWGDTHIRVQPLPVEIISTEAASVISDDYTVRIEHGYDLENILFTEQDRFGLITHKEIDYALYDKGCV